jgi:hypothetical protein
MSVLTVRNVGGMLLAGGFVFAIGAVAQQATSLPDAQIESNVLKALAGASELSTQNIQSATVYGTVTLSGNVQDEAMRTQAENLAARAQGVKKVVDELTIGDTPATVADDPAAQNEASPNEQPDPSQGNQPVLQSDGSYAPSPNGTGSTPPPDAQNAREEAGPPAPQGSDQGPGDQPRRPMYRADRSRQGSGVPMRGGQPAGMEVTVPPGAMLRVRVNRGLDSNHIQPGTNFDGTIFTDVVADGAVAIPRGAVVTGTVVDAARTGIFRGKGELSLQINSLTLGGRVYPLNSDIWTNNGTDKTVSTVNRTVGLGVVGAVIGALAGGGEGAAVGAGVGAGAGLAGLAASPGGQIIVPPESVLTFRTAAPLQVTTVSEQEMNRLAYAAGPQRPPAPRRVRYYSPYYGYYYGPPPYYGPPRY